METTIVRIGRTSRIVRTVVGLSAMIEYVFHQDEFVTEMLIVPTDLTKFGFRACLGSLALEQAVAYLKAGNVTETMTAEMDPTRAKRHVHALTTTTSVVPPHQDLTFLDHAFHQNGFVMKMKSGIAPMVLTKLTAPMPRRELGLIPRSNGHLAKESSLPLIGKTA